MEYYDLVETRKSTRDYKDWELSGKQMEDIRAYFGQCKRLLPEIGMELVILEAEGKEKLNGVAGYKGYLIQSPYYLILLTQENVYAPENAGYAGEDMVLKLTEMELDTCWLSFDDSDAVKTAVGISSDKAVAAILAFGYGNSEFNKTRLDIKSPSNIKVITRDGHIAPKICVEDLVYLERWGQKSGWEEDIIDRSLENAFYSASLAPSFLNRQPYRLIYDYDRMVLAVTQDELTGEYDGRLDRGIIMLHFAAVLSQWRPREVVWVMGKPQKEYGLEEGYEAVAYCEI